MIWAEHVARLARKEMLTEFWWRNLKERDHAKELGVSGRIIVNGSQSSTKKCGLDKSGA